MAVLGCVLYGSTTSKHLWCEYPTKIIVLALEEICNGNPAGLFLERTATTASLQSPDWLADLYHWGLSQAFSLLRLAQLSLTAFMRELQYELGMCASYGSPRINKSSQIYPDELQHEGRRMYLLDACARFSMHYLSYNFCKSQTIFFFSDFEHSYADLFLLCLLYASGTSMDVHLCSPVSSNLAEGEFFGS